MARDRDTGDGDDYTPDEEGDLVDVLDDAFDSYGPGTPTRADVTAQIEWAGTIDNNGRGGVRRTRLDGLDPGKMRELRDLAEKAREATAREAGAAPLRSYKAKGWEAKLHKITSLKRGPEAAAMAGLAPAARTLRKWLAGKQTPNKANMARINRAYDELRNPARMSASKARHEAAEKLTEVMRDRYGVNVRFREIESWMWR